MNAGLGIQGMALAIFKVHLRKSSLQDPLFSHLYQYPDHI